MTAPTHHSAIQLHGKQVNNSSDSTRTRDRPSNLDLGFRNCYNRNVSHHISDNESIIILDFNTKHFNEVLSDVTSFCALHLSVPKGMVAAVVVKCEMINCQSVAITLFDDEDVSMFNGCPLYLPKTFVTYSRLVTIKLTFTIPIMKRMFPFRMELEVATLSETSSPHLEVTYDSATSGLLFQNILDASI